MTTRAKEHVDGARAETSGPTAEIERLRAEAMKSLMAGRFEDAQTALRSITEKTGEKVAIDWRGVSEIFAPLPPQTWLVRDLQLCPGRPNMVQSYGNSGKSIVAQSIGLSI